MPWPAALVLDILLTPLVLCAMPWVRWRQAAILREGAALTHEQVQLARSVGVMAAERVRVMTAHVIPLPIPQFARNVAQRVGWTSAHIAGMTLGHGIVLRADCGADLRLLAHELAHVGQVERLGGIAGFLRQYLRECVWPGYPHGALEAEARAAEERVLSMQRM